MALDRALLSSYTLSIVTVLILNPIPKSSFPLGTESNTVLLVSTQVYLPNDVFILSNSLSRVHECDRRTPRYDNTCHNKPNHYRDAV